MTPESLSDEQRALYSAIAEGPRAAGPQLFRLTDDAGCLQGPFGAMLLSPPFGQALQAVGSAVRYRSVLTDRIREMAILVVAAEWDSAFERYAHEAVGRHAGVTTDEIACLRARSVPPELAGVEAAAIEVSLALARDGDLSDGLYAHAREALGERALFEISTLVGYYALLALQLRVFRADPPSAGTERPSDN